MQIALGISFGMIAAAPFVGRWRANVWLKKHMTAERSVRVFLRLHKGLRACYKHRTAAGMARSFFLCGVFGTGPVLKRS